MSCRSTSRRRTWTISCISTTRHRSADHSTADAGNRITGLNKPPVIGMVAVRLRRRRTSLGIPSRRRTAAARRRSVGSRSGLAVRTSLANRIPPKTSETSPMPHPTPQKSSGRGIERAGDSRTATGTSLDPATVNDGSDVDRETDPFAPAWIGGISENRCSVVVLAKRTIGTSHESPRKLKTGSTRSSANVMVHSRWRTPAGPFRASHARASAADNRIVARTTSSSRLEVAKGASESIIFPPRTPGRSAP